MRVTPRNGHGFRAFVLFALLAVAWSMPLRAAAVTLGTNQSPIWTGAGSTLNQGRWEISYPPVPTQAFHDPEITNTFTGLQDEDGMFTEYRSFFTFDLDQLGGEAITSATLQIYNGAASLNSGSPPWVVQFFDVTSSAADVRTGTDSVLIYNDLGTGVSYGSFAFNEYSQYVSFTLNAAAIAAINAQGSGYFTIGARLDAPIPGGVFGYEQGVDTTNYLVVETDSPSAVSDSGAFSVFGVTLAALLIARRRK